MENNTSYRFLVASEIIEEGDECLRVNGIWGVIMYTAGLPVEDFEAGLFRRPIKESK